MAVAIATLLSILRARTYAQVGPGMAWALLLSLALLSSQFLGLLHGIAHAGWPVSLERTAQSSVYAALFNYFADAEGKNNHQTEIHSDSLPHDPVHAQHDNHHHSCLEYAATTGAAGIHVQLFSLPLIPRVQVLALWQAFCSWDAPVVCHFSSRAPPH